MTAEPACNLIKTLDISNFETFHNKHPEAEIPDCVQIQLTKALLDKQSDKDKAAQKLIITACYMQAKGLMEQIDGEDDKQHDGYYYDFRYPGKTQTHTTTALRFIDLAGIHALWKFHQRLAIQVPPSLDDAVQLLNCKK
jgi:hypothetical protein